MERCLQDRLGVDTNKSDEDRTTCSLSDVVASMLLRPSLDPGSTASTLLYSACLACAQAEASSIPPAKSVNGDLLITLDDGSRIPAHSVYLQHASEVFTNALDTCPGQAGAPEAAHSSKLRSAAKRLRTDQPPRPRSDPLELALPSTSKRQALLLLNCLYAWTRETTVWAWPPPDLLELARVSHRFGCTEVLQLADSGLVKMCKAEAAAEEVETVEEVLYEGWLNFEDAPAQHRLARDLHLTGFEACIGRFMGMHANDVDLESVDPSLAAVLEGARKIRK